MSCYWDTLIKEIRNNDIKLILELNNPNPQLFASKLKLKNKLVNTIICNNNKLSSKQQEENYEHIKEYDINQANNGYLCSTCDPFLILIADLFSITIINNYDSNKIIYKPIAISRYEITINNNKGHMW